MSTSRSNQISAFTLTSDSEDVTFGELKTFKIKGHCRGMQISYNNLNKEHFDLELYPEKFLKAFNLLVVDLNLQLMCIGVLMKKISYPIFEITASPLESLAELQTNISLIEVANDTERSEVNLKVDWTSHFSPEDLTLFPVLNGKDCRDFTPKDTMQSSYPRRTSYKIRRSCYNRSLSTLRDKKLKAEKKRDDKTQQIQKYLFYPFIAHQILALFQRKK